jgi:Cu-processing system permease protein
MLTRVIVVTLNTFREAVRARVLLGLFAIAIATAGYTLIVGEYAAHSRLRVVSDLGAASISIYAIVAAVVLGATSLHRELELKTIFPILARPIRRSEYLVGKYLGILTTLTVFIAANCGALLFALGIMADRSVGLVLGIAVAMIAIAVAVGVFAPKIRTFFTIPWALCLFGLGIWLASPAPDDASVLAASAVLTLGEVAIVTAVAMVLSSFSSPALTAALTLAAFIIGRSAEMLAKLPEKMFGSFLKQVASWVSTVSPDLAVYVPARPLLVGAVPDETIAGYVGMAVLYACAWSIGLIAVAALLFQRRDFL